MRKLRSLLIVLPSMALGAVLTASLTTTAKAAPLQGSSQWEYLVVATSEDLKRVGLQGWEYSGESAASGYNNVVERRYTLRRRK